MEDKLDSLSSSLKLMQDMMTEKGFFKDNRSNKKKSKGQKGKSNKNDLLSQTSSSETTIYKNAVKRIDTGDPEISFNLKQKRDSSSSEDSIDTSDELIEIETDHDIHDKFIADCARQVQRDEAHRREIEYRRNDKHQDQQEEFATNKQRDLLERSQEVIKEAKALKARLFATKGNCNYNFPNIEIIDQWGANNMEGESSSMRSADVDEKYLVIGAHINIFMQQKIVNCKYVDFSKLLPKGRFGSEENRLELVSRGGATYFVPVQRDTISISSFSKWEQAFRVFSNIFTRAHQSKASELIQYNHIIHTAANTFIWENIYMYDKEFHMHISHFPQRSWSLILQQAWSMYLKDRIQYSHTAISNTNPGNPSNGFRRNGQKVKENCRRFNKGKCPNGASCKYDHRCNKCGKFGHGAHIC